MKSFVSKNIQTMDYRPWLASEFTRRCKSNPSYSLRGFAKFLDLDPSTVSQLLSGKRKASAKMVKKLCDAIGVDLEVEEALIRFANIKNKRNQLELIQDKDAVYRQMTLDACALISDWYNYAILEITFVQDFKNDPKWIAKKLGITATQAQISTDILKRLELLEEVDGRLVKTETFLTNFSEGVTSKALKNIQKDILSMAFKAVDEVPQEEKDITSMTFAIDESKMSEAREYIKKFRREISSFLENGNQTRVYHLGIQLYPVSKR